MRSCKHCCSGKAISVTYSEFVSVASDSSVQSICAILSPVVSLAVKYFAHYLKNGTIFEKKGTEHKICVLIFLALLSETFLILSRTGRDMIINVYRSACEVPLLLSDCDIA